MEVIIDSTNRELTEREIKTRLNKLELYRAALFGDWKKAEKVLNDGKIGIKAKISTDNNTLLHIAVAAERTRFVKKLIEKIDLNNINIFGMRNIHGYTPFCLAAACGSVELARVMMKKKLDLVGPESPETVSRMIVLRHIEEYESNPENVDIKRDTNLAMIAGRKNMVPLEIAALFGHREMVQFLYKPNSVESLNDNHRVQFLVNLIRAGLYDFALDLVKNPMFLHLATARTEDEETALHALARIPMANQQGILKRFFNRYCTYLFPEKKGSEAVQLVEHLWRQVIILDDWDISKLIGTPQDRKLIFVAAAHGNIEFLNILICGYPDLVFKVDENIRTIFHYAVMNRHKALFKLIYKIGSFKNLIAAYKDDKGNNILHLAGMLPPMDRLNIVTGAALQMQQELLWFKEVSTIMHPLDAIDKNKNGKTPGDLFTEQHEKLKEDGEKWMKGTAKSCMIVAALIATVVFAAAFTVPGSTKQDTGTPNFILKDSFTYFAISDAISLVSSCCSIVTFLSILTSRYAEQDFVWWLPSKLFVGLLTLFISLVAMMVVFCSAIFIVFNDGKRWCALLVMGISAVPVILFSLFNFRLSVDFGNSIMYLLFSSSLKSKLFS